MLLSLSLSFVVGNFGNKTGKGKVHSFDTARCYLYSSVYFTPCIFLSKVFFILLFWWVVFLSLIFQFSCCVHNIIQIVTNAENTNSILKWIVVHGKFDEIVWHFLQDSSVFYCSLVRLMAADFFHVISVRFFRKAIKHLSNTCFNIDKTHQPIWCDVFAALCVPYTVHALNITLRNLW